MKAEEYAELLKPIVIALIGANIPSAQLVKDADAILKEIWEQSKDSVKDHGIFQTPIYPLP
jgi:hypothetical protein